MCTLCGDVSFTYDDIKNIIQITSFKYGKTWLDGIDTSINITNCMSEKTIKYVYLTVELYNSVGDVVVDEVTGAQNTTIEYVGPLGPGEMSGTYDCGVIFNNKNFDGDGHFLKCEIIYMDGSSITLDENDCFALWESMTD